MPTTDEEIIGKRVWVKVEDWDLWALGTVDKHWQGQVHLQRAHTPKDIKKAMQNLGSPNENESNAVDARQELDLKIGVAWTRFQTQFFKVKFGSKARLVSYGPVRFLRHFTQPKQPIFFFQSKTVSNTNTRFRRGKT